MTMAAYCEIFHFLVINCHFYIFMMKLYSWYKLKVTYVD